MQENVGFFCRPRENLEVISEKLRVNRFREESKSVGNGTNVGKQKKIDFARWNVVRKSRNESKLYDARSLRKQLTKEKRWKHRLIEKRREKSVVWTI